MTVHVTNGINKQTFGSPISTFNISLILLMFDTTNSFWGIAFIFNFKRQLNFTVTTLSSVKLVVHGDRLHGVLDRITVWYSLKICKQIKNNPIYILWISNLTIMFVMLSMADLEGLEECLSYLACKRLLGDVEFCRMLHNIWYIERGNSSLWFIISCGSLVEIVFIKTIDLTNYTSTFHGAISPENPIPFVTRAKNIAA